MQWSLIYCERRIFLKQFYLGNDVRVDRFLNSDYRLPITRKLRSNKINISNAALTMRNSMHDVFRKLNDSWAAPLEDKDCI